MKNNLNPLGVDIRKGLSAVAAVGLVATPIAVLAQDQDDDEGPGLMEVVVTTGTRIPVDTNLISTSPVTSVSAEELAYTGATRVEDLINDLPQVVPELTANDSNGSTRTATLDLRGLGSDRTLVLVNGHRLGFGDPFALAPDINVIPGNLVERVELLTGGASSTYGSDAVAGVINFIMKDDFEGFQFDVQTSYYKHDNDNGAAQATQLPCDEKYAVDGDRMARMTPGNASENIGQPLLPSRRDDLHVEELDGEAVLYDPRNGAIHRFNTTTFSVWNACEGSCTPNEIAVSLAEHYSVETDEVLLGVRSAIGRLDEQGLLNKERSGVFAGG